ncbi:putative assembly chaperone of rpl4 [Bagarius yarrelli]|uniref:Putative assembly chaperone of rpl4 n=1 Tax=Bagarius yarrelli TaxID=175774 RepID=A0A556TM41_BAGYA|nr:putative assembly chaperone of rpl4 [Bagarius yarrelli]
MGGQAKAKKKSKSKRKENRRDPENAGPSPQDRMKAKMQERAKKKTAEKYTIHQLLEKTEECMDNFDLAMAKMFCQRALDIEPTNLTVLDMLGNICAELGDMDKAKQVGSMGSCCSTIRSPRSTKDVSVAFCSIAEIFFTDLCMEEGAAERCKEAIEKALHYDQNNPEALQLMASYLFSIEKPEEGRNYLIKSVSSWLPSRQKEKEEEASACSGQANEDEEEEKVQSNIPPYESRITTAKLLIEVEEFEVATDVLEGLIEEDDEVVQLYVKLRCDDAPVLEHTEQLLGELGGELVDDGIDDAEVAGPSIDDIGDDFIQTSEDEEDDDDAMEH